MFRLAMLLIGLAITVPSHLIFAQNVSDKNNLDFILKDNDDEKGKFFKYTDLSYRFSLPLPLSPLPDSVKFSPFNSFSTGIYMKYNLEFSENFSIRISPMLWFHKVGYQPSASRVFPSVDSGNTLEKLRAMSLGLSVELLIIVAKDNKGRPGFVIAPGFETDFPIIQTLKKSYRIKTPNGSTYEAKTKIIGLDVFYPYRYSAHMLVGHRNVGIWLAYWFTPWFKPSKYDIVKGIPIVSETGSRTIPPVSQFEIGIYWGI